MAKNNTLPIGIEANAKTTPSHGEIDRNASHIPFEAAYKKFLNEVWRSIVPRTYDRLKVLRKAVDVIEEAMGREWPEHVPWLKDNFERVRGRLTVDIANELMGVTVRAGLPRPSELVREWRTLTGGARSMWNGKAVVPYDRRLAAELRLKAQGRK